MSTEPTKPNDLITQKDAAHLIGRGVDTIRRWRRDYELRAWRDASPTAPAMVSQSELLAIAGKVSTGPKVTGRALGRTQEDAHQEHIKSLRDQIDDLRQQRAEMGQYVDMLRNDTQRLRNEMAEKNKRIDALELELGGPVRALIGVGKRKLLGRSS